MRKPLLLSLVSKDRTKDILLTVFPLFPFLGARRRREETPLAMVSVPESNFLKQKT
jgi:hypothetical protein